MDPNQFRESRQAINRLCDNIDQLIEAKSMEDSKECLEEVHVKLDTLRPHAEGEIQLRSVKNLGMKLNGLAFRISKLKPKKTPARKRGPATPKIVIQWDEERVEQLSLPFLKKVYANMGGDADAKVFFGTTGKGIRPNYRVEFTDDRVLGFTGSGHKPQETPPASGAKNLSDPFSYEVICEILQKK